jgi:MFS family permease
VLLLTQFVQAALAVLMGVLIVSHRLAVWHVAAIAALLGVAAAFEVPADSALVPELVDKDAIRVAIGLDRSLFHATRFLGPALAGVVIAKLGAASAFFINALSFAALVAAILTLAPRKLGSAEEEEQRAGGMKDGIAYLRGDKPTLSMIGLLAASTLFIAPVFIVVLPIYVKDVLHLGAEKLGYLMSVSGVGSMLGAISLLAIAPEKRVARLFWAVSSGALATVGFALAPNFWVAAGCMVFMSVGVATVFGVANTIVQERTPDFLRGRVSALAGLSFFGLIPFAGVGFSSLADAIGMRHAILLGGVSFGIAATSILLGPGRRACFPVHEALGSRSATAVAEPLA